MHSITSMRIVVCAALWFSVSPVFGQEGLHFTVRAFGVEGEIPIAMDKAQHALTPFTGDNVGLEQLRNAAKALEALLADNGYPFYRVILPPQTIESTVTLRVLPFTLANIEVSGNHYFTNDNILASLPALQAGVSPNINKVSANRIFANEHPAKQVEVTFRQSNVPDSVDATVQVQDVSPLRFFSSLNNTGSAQSGRWRLSLGAQYANLFALDQSLTFSYSTSPGHWNDVSQYGVFYAAPVYRFSGRLSGFYTRSNVDTGTIANLFEVSGGGKFAGVHWTQQLPQRGAFSHWLDIGVEDRLFENNVSFAGTPIGVDVRSRPVSVSYQARYEFTATDLTGSLGYVHNLGGGGDNTNAAYLANRAGARRDWDAWRLSFDAQRALSGNWLVEARFRGQYAGGSLIPGEQFGYGGASGVRGLEEREATGDSGLSFSMELYPPPVREKLRFLAFFDIGKVWLNNTTAGMNKQTTASSIGAGARWTPWRYLAVSLDFAHVLDAATITESGDNMLHVAINMQY